MSVKFDLKEIKRRANYAAFQDGLMEIFMGAFLVIFGFGLRTNVGIVIIFTIILVVLGWPLLERLKRQLIYPRAGYVKLPSDPKTTGTGIAIAAVVMVVILLGAMWISILIMGQDSGLEFFLRYIVPPVSGFFLAIGPYWLGQEYGLVRGYLWAALFVLGGIAMAVFGIASGYEAVGLLCTVAGLLILVTGLVMFTQFMRKYPAQEIEIEIEEGSNA